MDDFNRFGGAPDRLRVIVSCFSGKDPHPLDWVRAVVNYLSWLAEIANDPSTTIHG
jgi:hypothetical protein